MIQPPDALSGTRTDVSFKQHLFTGTENVLSWQQTEFGVNVEGL